MHPAIFKAFEAICLAHAPKAARVLERVARPGALIVIGVPGFAVLQPPPLLRRAQQAARVPMLARLLARLAPGWDSATPVLAVHDYPGDYYRFSPQAMREVLLAGCRDIEIRIEMRPPRIIGFGWRASKPDGADGAAR